MREACAQHKECAKLFEELEACNNRVNSKSNTEEICVQELFDFLECRDKCVSNISISYFLLMFAMHRSRKSSYSSVEVIRSSRVSRHHKKLQQVF